MMPREDNPKFDKLRASNALEHCIRLFGACSNDQEIRVILARSCADSEAAGLRISIEGDPVFRVPPSTTGERVLANVDTAMQKQEVTKLSRPSKSLHKAGDSSQGSNDLKDCMESWISDVAVESPACLNEIQICHLHTLT